jgi:hypothetical protein
MSRHRGERLATPSLSGGYLTLTGRATYSVVGNL